VGDTTSRDKLIKTMNTRRSATKTAKHLLIREH